MRNANRWIHLLMTFYIPAVDSLPAAESLLQARQYFVTVSSILCCMVWRQLYVCCVIWDRIPSSVFMPEYHRLFIVYSFTFALSIVALTICKSTKFKHNSDNHCDAPWGVIYTSWIIYCPCQRTCFVGFIPTLSGKQSKDLALYYVLHTQPDKA